MAISSVPGGRIGLAMLYPRVISIIDAEIERLLTVRNLLLPPDVLLKTHPKKRETPAHLESKQAELIQKPATVTAALLAEVVVQPEQRPATAQIQKPARKQRMARAPVFRRRIVAPLATALGGVVPSAPVFVSATEVRIAQAQKEKAELPGRDKFASTHRETLTAELLSQRWLHSSGD